MHTEEYHRIMKFSDCLTVKVRSQIARRMKNSHNLNGLLTRIVNDEIDCVRFEAPPTEPVTR
jgi:hypothetical protein